MLPEPGRPFDADGLLALMRDSRRPGGVPDQLETRPIAEALAASMWTFDGSPWSTASAGGSCGPELCTLEIGGVAPGTQGEDLYIFSVAPATGAVDVLDASLRGVPIALLGELDTLTRGLSDAAELEGLILAGVRWLPPPDDGAFILGYRSGGEEGSCAGDITLYATIPELRSSSFSGC